MDKNKSSIWKLEIIWWLFTLIAWIVVLLPIFSRVENYPFYIYNSIYIILAISYTRYIFLFKYTPFARSLVFKIIVLATAVPVAVLLIDGISEFQRLMDENGYEAFLGHLQPDSLSALGKYIRSQYFFFGVTSVICSVLFPIRMLISIWRVRNRDTV